MKLSQFAEKVRDEIKTRIPPSLGMIRTALIGAFEALRRLASMTTDSQDSEIHRALGRNLRADHPSLLSFLRSLRQDLDDDFLGFAKVLFEAVVMNLETLAESTPTEIDDWIFGILRDVLAEPEAAESV